MALVGIPHGALDHLDIVPAERARFHVVYLAVAALFGALWWLYPVYGLGLFVAASAWHFGSADTEDMPIARSWTPVVALTRGAMVVALLARSPISAPPALLDHLGLVAFLGDDTAHVIVWIHLGIVALAARPDRLDDLLIEAGSIALWLWYADPILGFAGYFIWWHSLPQLRQRLSTLTVTWWRTIPHAAGATAVALVVPSVMLEGQFDESLLAAWLIAGASIALPHIVWVAWGGHEPHSKADQTAVNTRSSRAREPALAASSLRRTKLHV
jgi:Brp/Blh family beta-carotene 15,15'-monooxygenase